MLTAEIHITLKPGVLDPQGATLRRSLETLGHRGIRDVRMGKFVQVALESADRKAAEAELDEICRTVLANPVIEQYTCTVTGG